MVCVCERERERETEREIHENGVCVWERESKRENIEYSCTRWGVTHKYMNHDSTSYLVIWVMTHMSHDSSVEHVGCSVVESCWVLCGWVMLSALWLSHVSHDSWYRDSSSCESWLKITWVMTHMMSTLGALWVMTHYKGGAVIHNETWLIWDMTHMSHDSYESTTDHVSHDSW